MRVGGDAQDHGADVLGGGGLEQVRAAAGAVADVVADEVRDHARVARVVLGDARLDLAHEVGADVSGLGVDAAAELGEQRHERGTEAEADDEERRLRGGHATLEATEQREDAPHAEQRERHDEEAGDGAAAHGGLDRAHQAVLRGSGRGQVGAHADVHADDAREHRTGGTHQECERGPHPQVHAIDARVGHLRAFDDGDDRAHDDGSHHGEDADGGVLTADERDGALEDGGGDVLHRLRSLVARQHVPRHEEREDDRCDSRDRDDPRDHVAHIVALSLLVPVPSRDRLLPRTRPRSPSRPPHCGSLWPPPRPSGEGRHKGSPGDARGCVGRELGRSVASVEVAGQTAERPVPGVRSALVRPCGVDGMHHPATLPAVGPTVCGVVVGYREAAVSRAIHHLLFAAETIAADADRGGRHPDVRRAAVPGGARVDAGHAPGRRDGAGGQAGAAPRAASPGGTSWCSSRRRARATTGRRSSSGSSGCPASWSRSGTGSVLIDGIPLDESAYIYRDQPTLPTDIITAWEVPEGQLFVLGDHRIDSTDSRMGWLGTVPLERVIGRAAARYWPVEAAAVLSAPDYPELRSAAAERTVSRRSPRRRSRDRSRPAPRA